jgi:hypothetical protein
LQRQWEQIFTFFKIDFLPLYSRLYVENFVAGVSDHDALLANLTLNVVRPTKPPKIVFNFKRANWENLEVEFAQNLPVE